MACAPTAIASSRLLSEAECLRSTVPVGITRNVCLPLLEKESGLNGGKDFSVVFAPERTIAGKAIKELRTLPQIIGALDSQGAEVAAALGASRDEDAPAG